MRTKRGIIFAGLFFFIILIGLVSSACSVVDVADCDQDDIVVRLSSYTNAHGEVWNGGNYPKALCCTEGTGNRACAGSNEILRLSDSTNAHAEVPGMATTGYQSVCFEDFNCITATDCGPDDPILSLSSTTNAHLAGPEVYPQKICCDGIPAVDDQTCEEKDGQVCENGLACDQPTIQTINEDECCVGSCVGCSIEQVEWETSLALRGEEVKLYVTGDNCTGLQVNFEVWKDNSYGDEKVSEIGGIDPDSVYFNGDFAQGSWDAEYHGDESGDLPKYYFKIYLEGQGHDSRDFDGKKFLEVRDFPNGAQSCGSYTDETSCGNYDKNVAYEQGIGLGTGLTCDINVCEQGEESWDDCGCFWNESAGESGACQFFADNFKCDTTDLSQCGDGLVQKENGEECDPGNASQGIPVNLSNLNCSSWEGVTGNLVCTSECVFDFSSCGTSCDYDGIVDSGEMCDQTNFTNSTGHIYSCFDYDSYDKGSLSCNDCVIDQNQCFRSSGTEFKIGRCSILETDKTDCDDDPVGFSVISWNGTWVPGDDNPGNHTNADCENIFGLGKCDSYNGIWYYDPDGRIDKCDKEGESIIECPAEILLPFFGSNSFLISLFLIFGVYLGIILKKSK